MKVKIFTSYYGSPIWKKKKTDDASVATVRPISISLFTPRWFLNGVCDGYPLLAPPELLLREYKNGSITSEEYVYIYREVVLGVLNKEKVINDLGDGAVLLCYEKPGEFCHRHIVGEWLGGNYFGEVGEALGRKTLLEW